MFKIAVSRTSKPDYLPDEISIPDNYNVLEISEIHAFEEPEWRRELYLKDISDQLNAYSETYDVDEIWFLGDTGSLEDVQTILSNLEADVEVKLIAGDEDKKEDVVIDEGKEFTGWYAEIDSHEDIREPDNPEIDIDVPYEIFDEGFETEIKGTEIQAAHHPSKDKRPDSLSKPDERDDSFLEDLFSVRKETNENTLTQIPPPSLRNADMFIYDHNHMAYPRNIGNKAVAGRGGRRNNHARGSDCIPEASIHLTSFGDGEIHDIHYDAELDAVFEHMVFDPNNGYEMSQVPVPQTGNYSMFYKPVQIRFHDDQFNSEAFETEEDQPDVIKLEDL